MEKIKTTLQLVERILREYPEARDSDDELYIQVCNTINPMIYRQTFSYVMRRHRELGIPSYETVSRARRKAVERHPELAGCDNVQAGRELQEEAFREFAKGVF